MDYDRLYGYTNDARALLSPQFMEQLAQFAKTWSKDIGWADSDDEAPEETAFKVLS